jgi:TolA-binding protein
VRQATELEKAHKWNEMRAVYVKLEKVKGYNYGEALYHQAWAAFQSNATGDAVTLASQSAGQTGPFKLKAMMLYGDSLYRQGEYNRAKNVYTGLRKSLTGDDRIDAAKGIARCNKALKLPEGDGVVD